MLQRSSAFAIVFLMTGLPARAVDWPVFGFDPARSSFNSSERALTVGNVHRLRERWQIAFGAGLVADSTPIFLNRVRIGRSHRPMLYQTTTSGVTFGIEALSGRIVWKFATHGPKYTRSTPAADPSGAAIYAPGVDGKVHKLDAATGREVRSAGFPARVSHMPNTEADDAPLNVANGYVYATTSAYNDDDALPYLGHVVGVSLTSGEERVFNSLCSKVHKLPEPHFCRQQRSGIWSRGSAVVDPDSSMNGRIYVSTGNGDFNANTGGHNYGDSVLALAPDLSDLYGSYTPTDYQQLQERDLDIGSTSPTLLPRQPSSTTPLMLAQGGKDGVLRLVDRASLPGVGGELQMLNLPSALFSTPAVWTDASNNAWIFMGFPSVVQAYRLETSASGVSQLVGIWQNAAGSTVLGTSPVVANGIVFVAFNGQIVALNARTGSELWSSATSSSGKTIGSVHWESPIVVNGWVYCSDHNGSLTAYALP
ncbi:MAG TPA: PQQ-binding-like beta-propeller repeat protein [Candidatus Cybelea sp.]|jgi:outer membrane protein assembly factor BamB